MINSESRDDLCILAMYKIQKKNQSGLIPTDFSMVKYVHFTHTIHIGSTQVWLWQMKHAEQSIPPILQLLEWITNKRAPIALRFSFSDVAHKINCQTSTSVRTRSFYHIHRCIWLPRSDHLHQVWCLHQGNTFEVRTSSISSDYNLYAAGKLKHKQTYYLNIFKF